MSDIFISYASEDRELAAALAGKLTSRGYSVWWDHQLVGGSQFRDVIHKELNEARSVIVLWTEHSVSSAWVKDEADEALRLRKLLPLRGDRIEATQVPLGQRGSHIIPLSEFDKIIRTLRTNISGGQDLTPEAAIRKSGLAVAEAATRTLRYSYEYGLHIVICFVLAPIIIDILNRIPQPLLDHPVPGFSIWINLGIFFGCLGWSSLFAHLLKRRYYFGIFLVIMLIMLLTMLVYIFTPGGDAWAYYSRNFLLGIRIFLVGGGLLWVLLFVVRIRASLST